MRPAILWPASVRSLVPSSAVLLACLSSCGFTRLPEAVRGALAGFVGRGSVETGSRTSVGVARFLVFVDCLAAVFAITESSAPLSLCNNSACRRRTPGCAGRGAAIPRASRARTTFRRWWFPHRHYCVLFGYGAGVHSVPHGAASRLRGPAGPQMVRSRPLGVQMAKLCAQLYRATVSLS